MRRGNRRRAVLLCAALAGCMLLLTGCPAGSGGGSKSSSEMGLSSGGSYGTYENSSAVSGEVSSVQEARQNVKRIYTGDLSLEAVDFDVALSRMDALVEEYDGWYEEHDVQTTDGWGDSEAFRTADLTIRVPADNFDAMVSRINGAEGVSVVRQSVRTEDVSEQYYDVETRLANAKAEVERLQAMLELADTVEEMVSVQEALSDATYELESLTGQINRMDSRIGYSTLYVSLREVTALTMTAKVSGFGNKLVEGFARGFRTGTEFFADLVIFVVSNWLVLGVIVCVVVAIVWCSRKRKRKRKTETRVAAGAGEKREEKPDEKE